MARTETVFFVLYIVAARMEADTVVRVDHSLPDPLVDDTLAASSARLLITDLKAGVVPRPSDMQLPLSQVQYDVLRSDTGDVHMVKVIVNQPVPQNREQEKLWCTWFFSEYPGFRGFETMIYFGYVALKAEKPSAVQMRWCYFVCFFFFFSFFLTRLSLSIFQ
jgi:hypothetical protein